MTRCTVIFALAVALTAVAPERALAGSKPRFGQLQLGPVAPATRWALATWAQEVRLRTSIELTEAAKAVSPSDAALFDLPLLYLSGDAAFAKVADKAIARLREHLLGGGLLLVDDTGRGGPSEAFDRSVKRMLHRVFGQQLARVPASHVVYRSFYRLHEPVGRRADTRYLEGILVGKRYAVLYTRNDLQGAFARLAHGGPALRVVPGGESQREQAYRLAINLVTYALCLDYKDDHAHVMELLKRRRGSRSVGARGER